MNGTVLSGALSVFDVAKMPPNGTYYSVASLRRQNRKILELDEGWVPVDLYTWCRLVESRKSSKFSSHG